MYQQLRLEPYAVHTTFQYGGTEGKRHRLREAMHFLDPPEYYNPLGKLVAVPHSIWVCRHSLNFIILTHLCKYTHLIICLCLLLKSCTEWFLLYLH